MRIPIIIGLGLLSIYLFIFQNGTLFLKELAQSLEPGQPTGVNDLYQYWAPAKDWRAGHSLYRNLAETRGDHDGELGRSKPDAGVLNRNAYPPTSTLFFLPLAWLTFSDAVDCWRWLLVACYCGGVLLIVSEIRLSRIMMAFIAFICIITLASSSWLYHDFSMANVGGLIFALVTFAWFAQQRGYHIAAGVTVGIAVALKLFPGLLLIYLLFKNRKSFFSAITFIAIVFVITLLLFGISDWTRFLNYVVSEGKGWYTWRNNLSVFGFWYRLFVGIPDASLGHPEVIPILYSPTAATVLSLLSFATVGLLVTWTNWRCKDTQMGFAACLVGMILMNPVSWPNSLPLAGFAAVLVAQKIAQKHWQELLLGILMIVLWMHPAIWLTRWHTPNTPYLPWHSLCLISIKFYALLFLLLWIGKLSRVPPRTPTAT